MKILNNRTSTVLHREIGMFYNKSYLLIFLIAKDLEGLPNLKKWAPDCISLRGLLCQNTTAWVPYTGEVNFLTDQGVGRFGFS